MLGIYNKLGMACGDHGASLLAEPGPATRMTGDSNRVDLGVLAQATDDEKPAYAN